MEHDHSDANQPGDREGRQSPADAASSELVPGAATTLSSNVGFSDLVAPEPVEAAPNTPVRWMAFVSIIVGGALGALVGYGIGDVMFGDGLWSSVGALAGALTGALGVGILANLTMRAMGEWHSADHPEADHPEADHPEADHPEADVGSAGRRRSRNREWTRRSSN